MFVQQYLKNNFFNKKNNLLLYKKKSEYGSEDFEEFLGVLGEKIQLKSWERYRGGLDVKGIVYNLELNEWKGGKMFFII